MNHNNSFVTKIPTYDQLMNPLQEALQKLGGSGTIDEINEKVFEILQLPDEILEIPHGSETSRSEVEYRLAWARTYLKKYGAIDNSTRGVWSLKSHNKTIKIDPQEVVRFVKELDKSKKNRKSYSIDKKLESQLEPLEEPEELEDWRDKLKETLISLDASAFERLIQRLLRESGFIQVEVTGKSGDGGIDGKGIIRIGGFLSFRVMFQCKKYQGTVTAGQVRDFRGALQGRADKGLLITTGTFTRDATKEATRDGATPIDLIEGDQLVEKLKELSLGVNSKMIEKVEINADWFKTI